MFASYHGFARVVSAGLLGFAVLASGSAAYANLLTDPGYESNPLLPGVGVLTNIPGNAGIWGTENSAIVGVTGAISPAGGVRMLEMSDDGLIATQGWQAVNVSSFAAAIDAGQATFVASALYNVNSSVPAASAGTAMNFIDSSGIWGNITGPGTSTGLVIDNNPATWQAITDTGPVPVGTRWMVIQVAYSNATLMGTQGVVEHGYVDDAFLDIRVVPEPSTVALLSGLVPLLRRRRV